MTPTEFIAVAQRITYKPDCRLTFAPESHQDWHEARWKRLRYGRGVEARIEMRVPDAGTGDPTRPIIVAETRVFDCPQSSLDEAEIRDYVTHMVGRWLQELEYHELCEWFRVDGVQVYPTHIKDAVR